MNTKNPTIRIALAIAICVLIFAGIVFIFLKDYNISVQKKSPDGVACTMEAKLCPDGSAVGRVPPSCEFAPCPGEQGYVPTSPTPTIPDDSGNTSGSGTGAVSTEPVYPGQTEMAKIPDLPLGTMQEPSPPLTVTYAVEHRSALNEKRVSITGYVVANYLNNPDDCKPGQACMGMYMAPGVTIADSVAPNRNPLYDLRVIMTEEDRANANNYAIGKKVTLTATVTGNIDGITLSTANGY